MWQAAAVQAAHEQGDPAPSGVRRPDPALTEAHAPLVDKPHVAVGPRREAEQIGLLVRSQRDLGDRAGPDRPERSPPAPPPSGRAVATAPRSHARSAPARLGPGPADRQRAHAGNGGDQLAHASILRSRGGPSRVLHAPRGQGELDPRRACARSAAPGRRECGRSAPDGRRAEPRRTYSAPSRSRPSRHGGTGQARATAVRRHAGGAAGISVMLRRESDEARFGGTGREHLGRELEHLPAAGIWPAVAGSRCSSSVAFEAGRGTACRCAALGPAGGTARAGADGVRQLRRSIPAPGARPTACRPRSRSARHPRRSNRARRARRPGPAARDRARPTPRSSISRHPKPRQLAQRLGR